MSDASDLWWQWAEKPLDSHLTISGDIHCPVMDLSQRISTTGANMTRDDRLFAISLVWLISA